MLARCSVEPGRLFAFDQDSACNIDVNLRLAERWQVVEIMVGNPAVFRQVSMELFRLCVDKNDDCETYHTQTFSRYALDVSVRWRRREPATQFGLTAPEILGQFPTCRLVPAAPPIRKCESRVGRMISSTCLSDGWRRRRRKETHPTCQRPPCCLP